MPGRHRSRVAQWSAGGPANQREAARQHALVGQGREELAGAGEASGAPFDDGGQGAGGPRGERRGALALATDAVAMGLHIVA